MLKFTSILIITTAGCMAETTVPDAPPRCPASDLFPETTYCDAVAEINRIPFAAITPVMVTHRFCGKSIADLTMEVQRIKTALLRALLDNAYLAVNQITEVS